MMETTAPTTLLSTRKPLKIGTWNVRTLFETGKTAQVAIEMSRYNLSILGLSETRWTKSGRRRLATGEVILYSGHEEEDAAHTEGVAFMLRKDAQKALLGWEARGSRLITASFKTSQKKIKMNVILAYAPTNTSSEESKNEFYEQLEEILDSTKEKDVNILLGDFNAKVGNENRGYENCMGRYGLGIMNENGELFANMCAIHDFVIGGTIFQHKDIHKGTWVSPDHFTVNQIDHICINRKFRRSLLDVQVKRGADIFSDHHLVVGKVKLKLKKNKNGDDRRKPKYNVNLLNDWEVRDEFGLTLNNQYQVLGELIEEDEQTTVDEHWNRVKEAINNTCEEVLGRMKPQQKEWISIESARKIEERKRKKAAVNNSRTRGERARAEEIHTEANKEVKRSIRNDRRNYIEDLAREAEEAAASRNMKQLYDTTKKLCGKFSQGERPVKVEIPLRVQNNS